MHIKKAIRKVVCGNNLSENEMKKAFEQIMTGKATPAQIGAFITALRMKGETVDEIAAAAKVMRSKALKVRVVPGKKNGDVLVDTCGTGGTGIGEFNISTTAAFVLAGAGVRVAKHGNRSASGRSGSADVLEALGAKLDIPVRAVAECIEKVNIGFLFAPLFHKAMKYAVIPRKEIGIRTIFNILGP
ncbi:MAG: anthranilate phosphoribosyltransferase, partial [Candidatus Omnitrophota bacterium]